MENISNAFIKCDEQCIDDELKQWKWALVTVMFFQTIFVPYKHLGNATFQMNSNFVL